EDFFKQDLQRRFGNSIAVHQRLQRQSALRLPGRSDDCFSDFHSSSLSFRKRDESCRIRPPSQSIWFRPLAPLAGALRACLKNRSSRGDEALIYAKSRGFQQSVSLLTRLL